MFKDFLKLGCAFCGMLVIATLMAFVILFVISILIPIVGNVITTAIGLIFGCFLTSGMFCLAGLIAGHYYIKH